MSSLSLLCFSFRISSERECSVFFVSSGSTFFKYFSGGFLGFYFYFYSGNVNFDEIGN